MPVEQRIIGGGLLVAGIGVVLILLYVFSWGGLSPQDGLDQILNDLYPEYQAAVAKGDYLGQKRAAAKILAVLDEAGTAGVTKFLEGSATTDKEHRRLHDLMRTGVFEKNADGLYGFEKGWYKDTTHRALGQLEEAVTGELKGLRAARAAAADAGKAIAEIRMGSGAALEPPAAKKVPGPGNPLYANDAELYRVFGISGADVEAALGSKGPSAKARSARLRWNNPTNDSTRTNVSAAVTSIPEQADGLRRAAASIEGAAGKLASDSSAAEATKRLLAKAAALLGRDLAAEHAAAYAAMQADFESSAAIAEVLRNEADMLTQYGATVRGLGTALGKQFTD